MKKSIVLIFAVIMVFSLVACNNKESTKEDSTTLSNTDEGNKTEQIEKESESEKDEIASDVELSNVYQVAGKNIVVDTPNWQMIEAGYTNIFILHGIKYVAVSADNNSSVSTIEEAHDAAFDYFKKAIQNYSYVNSLNVENESYETINGIDVYKYEGTLNCALDYTDRDHSYDAYAIGYSFIMDGIPCNITGSVIDQEQSQEMIDEMRDTVEAMIQTLRSER